MRIEKEFMLREIAGEYIIIPTGSTVLDFNGLVSVNEVGAALWKMLQEDVSLEQLVQGVLAEYDVEEAVAREDIRKFLEALEKGGVLEKDEDVKVTDCFVE